MKKLFPYEIMDLVLNKKYTHLNQAQKEFVSNHLSEEEYFQLRLVSENAGRVLKRNHFASSIHSTAKQGIMEAYRKHHQSKGEGNRLLSFLKPAMAAAAIIIAGIFFFKEPAFRHNQIGPLPAIDTLADTIDMNSHNFPVPENKDTATLNFRELKKINEDKNPGIVALKTGIFKDDQLLSLTS